MNCPKIKAFQTLSIHAHKKTKICQIFPDRWTSLFSACCTWPPCWAGPWPTSCPSTPTPTSPAALPSRTWTSSRRTVSTAPRPHPASPTEASLASHSKSRLESLTLQVWVRYFYIEQKKVLYLQFSKKWTVTFEPGSQFNWRILLCRHYVW